MLVTQQVMLAVLVVVLVEEGHHMLVLVMVEQLNLLQDFQYHQQLKVMLVEQVDQMETQ